MTSKSDKIRGLFLSALMVMSVFAGTMAFAGAASAQAGNVEKGQAVYLTPNSDHWAGVSVFNATNSLADSSTTVQIMEAGSNDLYDSFNTDSEGDIKFSTEDMDGTYYLESGGSNVTDGSNNDLVFTVRSQDLTASFDSDVDNTYETDTNLTLESKRINYDATFEASGLSQSDLESILRVNTVPTEDGVAVEGIPNETVPTNFTGIDAGNYTFNVEVNDTGAVSEADVNVSEGGDAEATFASGNVVSEERGDMAEFTVNLSNTQSADVSIGSADVNWKANFTVNNNDDDSQVTVMVNTYETGSGSVTEFVEADGEDSISVDTSGGAPEQGVHTNFGDGGAADGGLGNPVAAGQYEMITGVSGTEQDVSQLSLTEGFVEGAQVWEHPDASSFPDSASGLVSGVADDDTLAMDDIGVVEFTAAGLYGNESLTHHNLSTNFNHSDAYSLNFTQTNPGANADPNTFEGDDTGEVYFDSANNTIYAAFDTTNNGIEAGDEYDVEFTVHQSSNVTSEARSANTTFSVEERTLAFSGVNENDVLNVSAGNATVEGETSAATGTEFTVQVQSDSFVRTSTATVDDGTFSADFDFSDVDTGTELTVSASTGSASANVDGMVVESADDGEDTTTTTEEDTETTTEEDTETTTTEEDTETTTTEASDGEDTTMSGGDDGGDEGGDDTTTSSNNGGIPGFGMAVSLVALVAAALLALRRSN